MIYFIEKNNRDMQAIIVNFINLYFTTKNIKKKAKKYLFYSVAVIDKLYRISFLHFKRNYRHNYFAFDPWNFIPCQRKPREESTFLFPPQQSVTFRGIQKLNVSITRGIPTDPSRVTSAPESGSSFNFPYGRRVSRRA